MHFTSFLSNYKSCPLYNIKSKILNEFWIPIIFFWGGLNRIVISWSDQDYGGGAQTCRQDRITLEAPIRENLNMGSRKKVLFCGPTTKALPPTPSSFVVIFFRIFFSQASKKVLFFLVVRPLTTKGVRCFPEIVIIKGLLWIIIEGRGV